MDDQTIRDLLGDKIANGMIARRLTRSDSGRTLDRYGMPIPSAHRPSERDIKDRGNVDPIKIRAMRRDTIKRLIERLIREHDLGDVSGEFTMHVYASGEIHIHSLRSCIHRCYTPIQCLIPEDVPCNRLIRS